ncbi:hypothetical protein P691DRAFT_808270 [Macrolepiota fuliginosa MF-IS2]|uniref:Uncharacterized protein n=1 Tax=Macrolepiota fuliginosa MF-IS2 TaxID=1400762 RepID=A0A9P6C6W9_9AGAR|nr:hypothetical protein P691DRAFT_808270 [Macrolepiota fuliginosa MF-IS2]
MSKAKDQKPFALSDTLRDLALLRASDLDLAALVPSSPGSGTQQTERETAVEDSLESSHEYVRSARTVIKISDRGDVDAQGQRIEGIREKLSDVEAGLEDA